MRDPHMPKPRRIVEIRRHGRVPARVPEETHVPVFLDEDDFDIVAEKYDSFGWNPGDHEAYLNFLHDYADVQRTKGDVYLVWVVLADYEEWCGTCAATPDDADDLEIYAMWLADEEEISPWNECFHSWASLMYDMADEDLRLDELGVDAEALENAIAPLISTIVESTEPLFGDGDHSAAIIDHEDDLIALNHFAVTADGEVEIWEDDLECVRQAIRKAWLWNGTVVVTREDLDGTKSRLAWILRDQVVSRLTSEQIVDAVGESPEWEVEFTDAELDDFDFGDDFEDKDELDFGDEFDDEDEFFDAC